MTTQNNDTKPEILNVSVADTYRTIADLFQASRPSSIYYMLLILSVIIVTAGLLLPNTAVVIGGMLVAPVFTPILVIALGLEVGQFEVIRAPLFLIGKSVVLAIGSALCIAWIFGAAHHEFLVTNDLQTAFLYFLVAVAAGVAGTFAWVHKEVSDILPGTAIAVALVPPLAEIGIWFSLFNLSAARFYVIVFMLNLLGIIIGSLLVFSFLQFYRAEQTIAYRAEQAAKEVEAHHKSKNDEE